MSLPTALYRPVFAKAGEKYLWDPRLIEAQVMVESSGDPLARRLEMHLDYGPDASYGLMQVLERTARALGMGPGQYAASLNDPYIGLDYGMRNLRNLVNWVGCADEWAQGKFRDVSAGIPPKLRIVLARYNGGGVGNPRADGTLRNEEYVQKIEAAYARVVQETA